MTIELSPELKKLVEEQVKAGRFASPTEAVNTAVDFMFFEHSRNPEGLRSLVNEGLGDIEAGRIVTDFNLTDFLAELRREFYARQGK